MPLRPRDDALPEGIDFSRIYDAIAVALSPYPVHSAPAAKREGEIACVRPVKSGLTDHETALDSIRLDKGGGAPLPMSFDHEALVTRGETFVHPIPTPVDLRRRSR